jgi:hypothetical protein
MHGMLVLSVSAGIAGLVAAGAVGEPHAAMQVKRSGSTGGAATSPSKTPPPRLYDVNVEVTLDTKVVAPGCEKLGCDGYVGTTTVTERFDNVRVAFKRYWFPSNHVGYLDITAEMSGGTVRQVFEQRNRFCDGERYVLNGKRATLQILGRVDIRKELGFTEPQRLDQEFDLRVSPGSFDEYPAMCASPRHVDVPVAARIGGSLVSGRLSYVSTSYRFLVGRTRDGARTFPLDRLDAGKGFTLDMKGTAADRDYPHVTTASARIVFTPRGRKLAGIRAGTTPSLSRRENESRTPAVVGSETRAGRTRCLVIPTGWWAETKSKGCFLVSANVQWHHSTGWVRDSDGNACKGSETTSVRWSAGRSLVWVIAARFPEIHLGTRRSVTSDLFDGRVRATVDRLVSGGAQQFGCVPMLSGDCGPRTIEFSDTSAQYVNWAAAEGKKLRLHFLAPTRALSPYKSCGLVPGAPPVFIGPAFDHGFALATATGRGSAGYAGSKKVYDIVERRLLTARVGQTVVFRGSGAPEPIVNSSDTSSGRWTGKLVFKRVS